MRQENAWTRPEKDSLISYVRNNGIHNTIWSREFMLFWEEALKNNPSGFKDRKKGAIIAMAYFWKNKLIDQEKETLTMVTTTEPTVRKCDRAQKIVDTLKPTIIALTALFESIEILVSDYKEQKAMLQDFKELREAAEKVSKRIIRNGA
jgi:hypothetical protein